MARLATSGGNRLDLPVVYNICVCRSANVWITHIERNVSRYAWQRPFRGFGTGSGSTGFQAAVPQAWGYLMRRQRRGSRTRISLVSASFKTTRIARPRWPSAPTRKRSVRVPGKPAANGPGYNGPTVRCRVNQPQMRRPPSRSALRRTSRRDKSQGKAPSLSVTGRGGAAGGGQVTCALDDIRCTVPDPIQRMATSVCRFVSGSVQHNVSAAQRRGDAASAASACWAAQPRPISSSTVRPMSRAILRSKVGEMSRPE